MTLVTLLVLSSAAIAQTQITIGTAETYSRYGPMDRYYNYSTHEAIYLQSEIHTSGNITNIAYHKQSGSNVDPIENVTIYMKHTTSTTLATGSYSLDDYTEVYSGAFTNNATEGWMEVALTNPFNYNNVNNLQVLIIKGPQPLIPADMCPWYRWTTTSPDFRTRQLSGVETQPTDLYETYERPNIRLTLAPLLSNDVGVNAILNPGATHPPNTAVIPQVRVTNYGTVLQSNFSVIFSIVGANGVPIYSNTQMVVSLGAGAVIDVNFSPWTTPTISEACNVEVRTLLDDDENSTNDTKTQRTLIISIEGESYAGGSEPGVVYKLISNQWQPISPALGYAVLSLCEYNGQLFAGTMSASTPYAGAGRVYRYDGTQWTQVGGDLDNQVACLVVFRGNLYAGTAWGRARLYRFEPATNSWTMVIGQGQPPEGWTGFRSAYVWNDYLYLGDINHDIIGRYNGTNFQNIFYYSGSCIYDFQEYQDALFAAAYNGGLLRYSNGSDWAYVIESQYMHMWELEVFQDNLYMATQNRLQKLVGANPVTVSTIGTVPYPIISMCKTGNVLLLGTGREAGSTYGLEGVGRIYLYDGTLIALTSGSLGSGIQALLSVPLQTQYYLTLIANPLGLTTQTGAGWYDFNTSANISTASTVVVPPDIYYFLGWTTEHMEEIESPFACATRVLMDEVKTLTASYRKMMNGTGGKSIGFWKNPGQSLLKLAYATSLNTLLPYATIMLYPREPAGSTPFNTTNLSTFKNQVRDYLQYANAVDMRYMLAAQLLATELSVLHDFLDANQGVWIDINGNGGWDVGENRTIGSIMSQAIYEWQCGTRASQELVKNWLDMINNNELKYLVCRVIPVTNAAQMSERALTKLEPTITVAPNPFTTHATIRYTIPISGEVTLKLYNTTGRLLETFTDAYHNTGTYKFEIRPETDEIPAGIYFLKYETKTYQRNIKLVIK